MKHELSFPHQPEHLLTGDIHLPPVERGSLGRGDGRNLPVRKSIKWAVKMMAGVWARMWWLPATGIRPTTWSDSRADVKFCKCFVSSRNIHPHQRSALKFQCRWTWAKSEPSKHGFTSSNPAQTENSGMVLTQQQTDPNPCNHHGSQKYCC